MALVEYTVNAEQWTLIGDNVTSITFQNAGQIPFYINFNSTNSAPVEDYGIVYGPWQGEIKKDVTELTYKTTPNYVFARAISNKSVRIIVETA